MRQETRWLYFIRLSRVLQDLTYRFRVLNQVMSDTGFEVAKLNDHTKERKGDNQNG